MKVWYLLVMLVAQNAVAQSASVSNGPVYAEFSEFQWGELSQVEYNGYLFECVGSVPVAAVTMVVVVTQSNGDENMLERVLSSYCKPNGAYHTSEKAYLTFTNEMDPQMSSLFAAAVSDKIKLSLAFYREDKWDSNYGQNYALEFEIQ